MREPGVVSLSHFYYKGLALAPCHSNLSFTSSAIAFHFSIPPMANHTASPLTTTDMAQEKAFINITSFNTEHVWNAGVPIAKMRKQSQRSKKACPRPHKEQQRQDSKC